MVQRQRTIVAWADHARGTVPITGMHVHKNRVERRRSVCSSPRRLVDGISRLFCGRLSVWLSGYYKAGCYHFLAGATSIGFHVSTGGRVQTPLVFPSLAITTWARVW